MDKKKRMMLKMALGEPRQTKSAASTDLKSAKSASAVSTDLKSAKSAVSTDLKSAKSAASPFKSSARSTVSTDLKSAISAALPKKKPKFTPGKTVYDKSVGYGEAKEGESGVMAVERLKGKKRSKKYLDTIKGMR